MSAFPSQSRRNAANCAPLNEAGTAKQDLAAVETSVASQTNLCRRCTPLQTSSANGAGPRRQVRAA